MTDRQTIAAQRPDALNVETVAELSAGGLMFLIGAHRGGLMGAILKIGGIALLYRGAIKLEPVRRALHGEARSEIGGAAIRVESSVDIDRPQSEIYKTWRGLENLPAFMPNLLDVREIDDTRSHWVAKGPAGTAVNFDAEIINEIENELIAWQTIEGSSVKHSGSVHFEPLGENTTRVRVVLLYDPPAHQVGAAIARLFGKDPQAEIDQDLARFKEIMETGKVPAAEGGGRSML